MAYQKSDKKKALQAYKEEILRDLKYFEKRIEEARLQKTLSYVEDDEDSDSDDILSLDMGQSIADLKLEQGRLQTCLHATQELTNLCVLQSEVNVLVNDPTYEREPPVTDEGTWREVTADCRVDLVPFSITFYVHQSSRLFGATSYRGLRVAPVKAAHETELAKSVLPRVATPSDAVEVLRSYAVAHRSRRTTLARLAEKYSNSLFMEPMADGGYIIKCANLLEVIWTLENKRSHVAPFYHRMKFDLEYMDEMYVKIISQAHRELSDPTLETDERTRLMSKIIATCLEAQGPTQELYESMESDIDSENLRKRRTTLDEEIEEPINKKKKDSEIMAPPKSLPKKTKPKGKENNANNKKDPKSVKRPVTDGGEDGAKKTKLSHDNVSKNNNIISKNKVDKEVASLKKVTDNKISNVSDKNLVKTNVDKENIKIGKEKSVSKSKNSNKDHVVKDIATNSKKSDKENAVTLKKGSDNKAGTAKNNVGSSTTLQNDKNNDFNTKQSTVMIRSNKDNAASKKHGNEQNLKGKSIHEKNIANSENTNKIGNVKKSNKKPNNMPNQDTAKDSNDVINNRNTKLKKLPKNVDETNTGVSQNDEAAKVSSQANIASKDNHLKAVAKISNKNINLKTKVNDNVKENFANINDGLITDNNTNKKTIIKAKVMEKINTVRPSTSNSGNSNTTSNPTILKNVNNHGEGNVNSNKGGKNIKSKSKEILNDNTVKTNLNKNIPEKEKKKHVTKENPINSALNSKTVKSHPVKNKIVNKPNAKIKQDETQLKFLEKNMNAKSKSKDKLLDKNDKANMREENDVENFDKNVNKNIAAMDKNVPKDLNEKNVIKTNENTGSKLLKHTTKQTLLDYVYPDRNKLLKPNLNVKKIAKNVTKTITNNINLRKSLSPIQKNKIKLLNPRNKISLSKLKVTGKQEDSELQNDNRDKNKMSTKIPQKLMSVHEKIVKKNPLRFSPRKMHSNMKTDSRNSSRTSQRSLQKATTGIPRLLKKPIR